MKIGGSRVDGRQSPGATSPRTTTAIESDNGMKILFHGTGSVSQEQAKKILDIVDIALEPSEALMRHLSQPPRPVQEA